MNTNIILNETQREELQASSDHLAKLLKKFASVDRQHADFEATKVKATARLAALEKTANEKVGEEAGEAASAKAYAIRDQLMRIDMTLRRLEQEFKELEAEAAKAASIARTEIRAAHRPLVKIIVNTAAELIAPFCERPAHAKNVAEQLYAVSQAQLFTRPNMPPDAFPSSGSILTDIEAVAKTLAAMLAGEAVVTVATGDEEGGLVFPAYV